MYYVLGWFVLHFFADLRIALLSTTSLGPIQTISGVRTKKSCIQTQHGPFKVIEVKLYTVEGDKRGGKSLSVVKISDFCLKTQ